ncbi:hypothetical protein ARMSODRAFT_1024122 [Armillaria solidipes]|uniref:Uncharacterized protein n=1 Tax=Armillaria solidipes TaxID=1076256 RepID=A0A2H3BBH2_9AGAR|nr:hypothetical protein ARMSODRAFT_1024122 [Armillaria solidipes]
MSQAASQVFGGLALPESGPGSHLDEEHAWGMIGFEIVETMMALAGLTENPVNTSPNPCADVLDQLFLQCMNWICGLSSGLNSRCSHGTNHFCRFEAQSIFKIQKALCRTEVLLCSSTSSSVQSTAASFSFTSTRDYIHEWENLPSGSNTSVYLRNGEITIVAAGGRAFS